MFRGWIFLILVSQTESHYVTLAGLVPAMKTRLSLNSEIRLPLPFECWDLSRIIIGIMPAHSLPYIDYSLDFFSNFIFLTLLMQLEECIALSEDTCVL